MSVIQDMQILQQQQAMHQGQPPQAAPSGNAWSQIVNQTQGDARQTMQGNPIQSGTLQGMETAAQLRAELMEQLRAQKEPQVSPWLRFAQNLAQDVGKAGLLSSNAPMAQQLGAIFPSSRDAAAARAKAQQDRTENQLKLLQELELAEYRNKERDVRRDELAETERHHRATEIDPIKQYKVESYKHKEALEKKFPQFKGRIISLNDPHLTAGQKDRYSLQMQQDVERYEAQADVLKTMKRFKTIVDAHPNLSTSATALLAAAGKDPESFTATLARMGQSGISKEDRTALEELKSLTKNMLVPAMSGVKARGLNQWLEKRLADGTMQYHHSPQTINFMYKNALTDFGPAVKRARDIRTIETDNGYVQPEPHGMEDEWEKELAKLQEAEAAAANAGAAALPIANTAHPSISNDPELKALKAALAAEGIDVDALYQQPRK